MTSELPEPLVTIVTPTYEMPGFLPWALASVRAQDYANIEYIVVDGGNDAETPQVVEQYRDVVSTYLRESDTGQSNAINKGFRRAKGEIVAWLNADDYYFPDAVSRAVRVFREHPEVDVFYGDAVYTDREGQFIRYFTEVEPFDGDRLCTSADFICQPTTFFRRSALERVGLLDESLHFTMDWDLWCRFVRAGCGFHYERALIAANREYGSTKTVSGGLPRLREILQTNWRHKRGRVPWASASFALRVAESLPVAGHVLTVALAAKRGLAGRYPVTPLYGLEPGSRAFTRTATVSLPVPGGRVTRVELRLAALGEGNGTELHVGVNAKMPQIVRVPSAPSSVRRTVFLDPSVGPRIDVHFNCRESQHSSPVRVQLEEFRLGLVTSDREEPPLG